MDTTGRTIDDALDDVLVALRDSGHLDLVDGRAPTAGRTATPTVSAQVEEVAEGSLRPAQDRVDRPVAVLFVCTANICRSPYMELRASAFLAGDATAIEFASAGTHGFRARGVDATMAAVLSRRGVSDERIAAFRSRPLTRELIQAADLVLTAETVHREYVLEEAPGAFRKVFTLGQFADTVARVDAERRRARNWLRTPVTGAPPPPRSTRSATLSIVAAPPMSSAPTRSTACCASSCPV